MIYLFQRKILFLVFIHNIYNISIYQHSLGEVTYVYRIKSQYNFRLKLNKILMAKIILQKLITKMQNIQFPNHNLFGTVI